MQVQQNENDEFFYLFYYKSQFFWTPQSFSTNSFTKGFSSLYSSHWPGSGILHKTIMLDSPTCAQTKEPSCWNSNASHIQATPSAFSSLLSSSWVQLCPHLPSGFPYPELTSPERQGGPGALTEWDVEVIWLSAPKHTQIRGGEGLWTLNTVSLGLFGWDRRHNEGWCNDQKHLISTRSKQNTQVGAGVRAKVMSRFPASKGGVSRWGNPSSSTSEDEWGVAVLVSECFKAATSTL